MARLQFKHGLLKMPTAWTSENLLSRSRKKRLANIRSSPCFHFLTQSSVRHCIPHPVADVAHPHAIKIVGRSPV